MMMSTRSCRWHVDFGAQGRIHCCEWAFHAMIDRRSTAEGLTWAADKAVMRPRVPRDQIEAARAVTNPLPASEEMIAKGKALYEGKAFCKVCHGPDGKGLGKDIAPGSLKGPLPRNFTDKKWQAARTDGELFWILKNGSKGTAMAPFIPLILTEEEAWQVLRYVRSFGQP